MSTPTQDFDLLGEEYQDDRSVFLVDDGERHWYVAEDAAQALAAHLSLMEPDDDAFTVTKLAPSAPVVLCLDDRADAERLGQPPFELLARGEDDHWWRVRAPAGVWAAREKAGEQICSTCFP